VISRDAAQAEAVALRSAGSWSVPTPAALEALGALSPLVELGAGNGLWAGLLRQRGADVLAFDTVRRAAPAPDPRSSDAARSRTASRRPRAPQPTWSDEYAPAVGEGAPTAAAAGEALMGERHACVVEGGPEEAARHPDRTLVLMWPDYHGHGSYGLACLRQYAGARLALVGEWRGRTFGAYTAGIPETGQSFSAEFQAAVEAEFQLEQNIRLPNWPYYLDTLMVWRRKGVQ
jgi:hypothetical protein